MLKRQDPSSHLFVVVILLYFIFFYTDCPFLDNIIPPVLQISHLCDRCSCPNLINLIFISDVFPFSNHQFTVIVFMLNET